MPITKHKIFKLKIREDAKFSLDSSVEKEINDFLSTTNYVYINHSITTLSEDVETFGVSKTINRIVLISLIYKDLSETSFDLKNTSKKVQRVVKKEIEKDVEIEKPNIETDIDKQVQSFMDKIPIYG
jgi:hypothetical protein